ncbi:FkbM family methyltransferase [Falsiphaeobacter marinintestinus]|uniref:FkbM family methyltransferase n=1 Tax=Falsiphaeobacter marinintestinus TaxID=1492905 RepID=UPI0011B7B97F|nr:FkbM family methyltransferase [Phaeobacter marinintestinus]
MSTESLKPLSDFAQNTYSQTGEDGILAECLSRISKTTELDKWCVEFGAWDGVHLSNTCRLIREDGYSAVLVEGNEQRFREQQQNLPEDRVLKFLRWVSLSGEGRLETILAETPIPHDFDFLSIDIDGCDWHIWNSIEAYRPKVVCIEFNPTIPNCLPYVQPADFEVKHGNGPRALCDLAGKKGYVLATVTGANLIFVEASLADAVLGSARPTLDELRPEEGYVSYVFAGYNGEVVSTGPVNLFWHHLKLGPNRMRVLPKSLCTYPDDYTPWQRIRYKLRRELWRARYGKSG